MEWNKRFGSKLCENENNDDDWIFTIDDSGSESISWGIGSLKNHVLFLLK